MIVKLNAFEIETHANKRNDPRASAMYIQKSEKNLGSFEAVS